MQNLIEPGLKQKATVVLLVRADQFLQGNETYR